MITFSVPKDLLLYSHEMSTPSDFSVRGFSGGQGEDGSSMTFKRMADGEAPIEPWTPAEITTALWLDAADSATITLNGSTVSEWRDKSGNARHATQSTGAYMPQYAGVSLNGIIVPSGDGLQRFMNVPAIQASPGIELFFAIKQMQTGSNRNGDVFTFSSYTQYQGHFGGGPDLASLQDWYTTFFTDSQKGITLDSVPPGDYICSISHTGAYLVGRINASIVGTTASAFNGSPSMRQVCGNSAYSSSFVAAKSGYAEYILVQSPTDTDRQRIEGYLAHKWGLAANLPSDHPYKTAAPTL